MQQFFSRRNSVFLDNNGNVVKRFCMQDSFDTELSVYKILGDNCDFVPNMLRHSDREIVKQYIKGETLLDILQQCESSLDKVTIAQSLDALIDTINRFHIATKLVANDVNLSNYIMSNGKVYFVDLEQCQYGKVASDYGKLIAFVLTYNPIASPFKLWCCRYIINNIAADHEVQSSATKQLEMLAKRRKTQYNIDIDKVFQQM